VRTVANSEKALELFEEESFDVIISDYKLPEKNGIKLLKEVREVDRNIPFVMLTGKGDENIAIKALNLGANKYFKKEPNPRGLYNGLSQAIKEVIRRSGTDSLLRYYPSGVSMLLEDMLEDKIETIEPMMFSKDNSSISYPEAEKKLELSTEKSIEILESLVDDGYLKKDFYDQFLVCPGCVSSNIKISTTCPKCGSLKSEKKEIIEHLDCGYQGSREKFENEDGDYICPKCHKELQAIGVDYSKMSDIKLCKSCGKIFDTSDYILRCDSCEKSFDIEEGEEKKVYSYRINERKKPKIRALLEQH